MFQFHQTCQFLFAQTHGDNLADEFCFALGKFSGRARRRTAPARTVERSDRRPEIAKNGRLPST
jgi:hypothetical protein